MAEYQHDDLRRLFDEAIAVPRRRASFLARACGGDTSLERRVLAMIDAAEREPSIATPTVGEAPSSAFDAATQDSGTPGAAGSDLAVLREGPGTRIGPYKILQLIGEGGFGSVFMAEQEQPVQRRVALKIIKLGMDTRQVVARFEQERQALALMDHPNIARVLDAGATDTGRPYFVMELVKGEPIGEYCDRAGLSIPDRLELFALVCAAVQHAHTKGIIHRDLKPSNILVSTLDGRSNPKVIDFGIAKATSAQLTNKTLVTERRQFVGTPEYMSPEQAEGSLDIDTRTDVYSLGVLLYQLLTGTTPFTSAELRSADYGQILRIIRESDPPPPSTRLSRNSDTLAGIAARRHIEPRKLGTLIRGELDWIVMKAMDKDRLRRYETANGLAMDVRRYLAGEPVVAAPASTAYRAKKFIRRYRAAVIAGSVLGCSLVLGIAGTTTGMVSALRQTSRAESAEGRAQAAQAIAVKQRDLAQDRLYDSLVREARAIRISRQLGYRREVFDRIRQAAAIPTANRNPTVLLSEATRCLGDPVGLEPVTLSSHWKQLPNQEMAGLRLHAISPNGEVVANAHPDGRLEFFDSQSGKATTFLEGQGRPIEMMFTSGSDRLIGLIERGTEGPSLAEWRLSTDGVWTAQSPPQVPGLSALLAASNGVVGVVHDVRAGTFQLRNLESGDILGALGVPPLCVASETRLAAFRTGNDSSIVLWDLVSATARATLNPRLARVKSAIFSPDGAYLVCDCETGIAIYDTQGLDLISSFRGYFNHPAFQNRSTLAIPLPQEKTVRFYNVATHSDIARLAMGAQQILFARDVETVLATDNDLQVIRLGGTPERMRLSGHVGGVPAVEFSPDGSRLASIGKDQTLRIWNAATGEQTRAPIGLKGPGQGLSFSPNGRYLATCEWNGDKIQIWSLTTQSVAVTLGGSQEEEAYTFACSFSQDGRYLASSGTRSRIWEIDTSPTESTPRARELLMLTGDNWAHQFDAAHKRFAYLNGAEDQAGTYFLNLGDEHPSPRRVRDRAGSIQQIGVVPGLGEFISMAGSELRSLEIWNPESGETLRTFTTLLPGEPSTGSVGNMCVSPDGSKVAVANGTGRGVNVMDLATGRRLFALGDELGSIWWLAWSPDGTRLAVSRSEGDISVWDLARAQVVVNDAGLTDSPKLQDKR